MEFTATFGLDLSNNHALIHRSDNVSISGSKLISNGEAIRIGYASGIVNIDNSEIIGDISSTNGSLTNIGGSKVAGTISGSVNLVNCYDGNYQLIP